MLIPIEQIVKKYNVQIRGVLHVGAHFGQEYDEYIRCGANEVIFIEPCKNAFASLKQRFESTHNVSLINVALGDKNGSFPMYSDTTNQGQSNSLMKPKIHLEQHPEVLFDNEFETVEVRRLSSVAFSENVNLLVMDVQGYELEVCKGGASKLGQLDIIYSECHRQETYEGCPMLEDMDSFLSEFSFIRVETRWASDHLSWGDAVWIKKDKLKMELSLHYVVNETMRPLAARHFLTSVPNSFRVMEHAVKIPTSGNFQEDNWDEVLKVQTQFIIEEIKRNPDDGLMVWCDVDIVFFGNCVADLAFIAKGLDLVFQRENNWNDEVNMGIQIIRRNSRTLAFYTDVLHRQEACEREYARMCINSLLRLNNHGVKWNLLPLSYSNESNGGCNAGSMLYHANCTAGDSIRKKNAQLEAAPIKKQHSFTIFRCKKEARNGHTSGRHLQHLAQPFADKDVVKLKLPNITLFGIDCVDIDRLVAAAYFSRRDIEFGAVKLLTSITNHHADTIQIDPVASIGDYSAFMIEKMDAYIDTEFALVMQHDGYVLNPNAWTDEFLKYDYIGAPVGGAVGNGGFSLRSKKLTQILARDALPELPEGLGGYYCKGAWRQNIENEDYIICTFLRQYLEAKGIRFAPVCLAERFSVEGNTWLLQFGFHGFQACPWLKHDLVPDL